MPYNHTLADKIRSALMAYPGVVEKQKMGGLSFMRNGKLCVRVQGDDLMIRCEPGMTDTLLARKGARRYEMKGKTNMKGWLLVGPEGTKNQQDFEFWIGIAVDFNIQSTGMG